MKSNMVNISYLNIKIKKDLQDKIKLVDKEISKLSNTMEQQIHTVKLYRQIYVDYKSDTSDKTFFKEENT